MIAPTLTFVPGELGIVVAMLGAKPAGQILPLANGSRASRYAFTLRMFDEPRCGSPAASLPAAKRALVAKINEVLWAAELLDPSSGVEVVDQPEDP